jgi:hypothetical protein
VYLAFRIALRQAGDDEAKKFCVTNMQHKLKQMEINSVEKHIVTFGVTLNDVMRRKTNWSILDCFQVSRRCRQSQALLDDHHLLHPTPLHLSYLVSILDNL